MHDGQTHTPPRSARRYFPERWKQAGAPDLAGVAQSLAADRAAPAPGPPALLARLLGRLGLRQPGRDAPRDHGVRRIAARRARLPMIADRLEVILEELDELEAWREAVEVASVIERLRAGSD